MLLRWLGHAPQPTYCRATRAEGCPCGGWQELSDRHCIKRCRWMFTFITLHLVCSVHWSSPRLRCQSLDCGAQLADGKAVSVRLCSARQREGGGNHSHRNLSRIWLPCLNKSCLQALPCLLFSALAVQQQGPRFLPSLGEFESVLVKRSCVEWDYLIPASVSHSLEKGKRQEVPFPLSSLPTKIMRLLLTLL